MLDYAFANANGLTSYISDDTFVFTGTWNSGGTYAPPLDVVDYNNGKFIVLVLNHDTPPLGSSSWSELVLRGTISPTDPFAIAQTALTTANAASVLALAAAGTATQALTAASFIQHVDPPLVVSSGTLAMSGTLQSIDFLNIDSSQFQTIPHNLGRTPILMSSVLVCTVDDTAKNALTVGQQMLTEGVNDFIENTTSFGIICDGTNFYFSYPMGTQPNASTINWNGNMVFPDLSHYKVTAYYM